MLTYWPFVNTILVTITSKCQVFGVYVSRSEFVDSNWLSHRLDGDWLFKMSARVKSWPWHKETTCLLSVRNYCAHRQYYSDVITRAMTSQITCVSLFSQPFAQAQIKENIKAPRHFVRGIQWWPVDVSHKGLVTWQIFPFHDVIMIYIK